MTKKLVFVFLLLAASQITHVLAASIDTKPHKKILYDRCLQQLPEEERAKKASKNECSYKAIMSLSGHEMIFDEVMKKSVKKECRKKSGSVGQCIKDAKKKYFDETFIPVKQ